MQSTQAPRPRGRPRQFNPDEVLDRAVEVFWERGYAGASLDDLTGAMGLNRPSVYAAFGGKQALFLAALDRYGATLGRQPLDAMLREPDPVEGMRAFLVAVIELAMRGPVPRGCLIACVASEAATCDPDARERVRQAIADTEGAIAAYLEARQAAGTEVTALAHVLASVMQGLAIRARAGVPRNELERVAAATLALLARQTSGQTS
jgi:AcrR family transcriptional regulator